jgi:ribosomal protein L24E
MDNIDTCLVCGKEIPPGPDFCSAECETYFALEGPMLKTTTYDWNNASEDVLDAMRDRCHEEGHEYQNCMSVLFQVYQRCKWCGERR